MEIPKKKIELAKVYKSSKNNEAKLKTYMMEKLKTETIKK
jgi:hypothetical protein